MNEKGFTITEVLIAATISLLSIMAVTSLYQIFMEARIGGAGSTCLTQLRSYYMAVLSRDSNWWNTYNQNKGVGQSFNCIPAGCTSPVLGTTLTLYDGNTPPAPLVPDINATGFTSQCIPCALPASDLCPIQLTLTWNKISPMDTRWSIYSGYTYSGLFGQMPLPAGCALGLNCTAMGTTPSVVDSIILSGTFSIFGNQNDTGVPLSTYGFQKHRVNLDNYNFQLMRNIK